LQPADLFVALPNDNDDGDGEEQFQEAEAEHGAFL
jgi:hypothetical protein